MQGRSFGDIYQNIGVTHEEALGTLPKPRDHQHRGHHPHASAANPLPSHPLRHNPRSRDESDHRIPNTNHNGVYDEVWDSQPDSQSQKETDPSSSSSNDEEVSPEPVLNEFPFGSPNRGASSYQLLSNAELAMNDMSSSAQERAADDTSGVVVNNMSVDDASSHWWNRPLELPAWALALLLLFTTVGAAIGARWLFPHPPSDYQPIHIIHDSSEIEHD
jgi:hypothetical protein